MQDVVIIGAGPSGLYAADFLAATGHSVTVVDRMPSPARKFLMAGRGGLNLTHSESLDVFLERYREAEPFLEPMIRAFPPEALKDWCHGLGQETFVGSSGRVFPKAMKASPLLRALLKRLEANGARLLNRSRFMGFDAAGGILIEREDADPETLRAPAVLLALGGASWPRLGSDAHWVAALQERGIHVDAFQPANCGFHVSWSPFLVERCAGSPLKRIALTIGGKTVAGEAMISEKGLEGGAVYALSAELREEIASSGTAGLAIDLRPALTLEELRTRLDRPRARQSIATFLKKALKLNPAELALLREVGPWPDDARELAARVKQVPVTCIAPYDINRSISSAGGICLDELTETLMIRKLPGVFAAGEMLNWEAPTGGYLLQACFATAHRAAEGIADYLGNDGEPAR